MVWLQLRQDNASPVIFDGESNVDLGEHDLRNSRLELDHRFLLRNSLSKPVQIQSVKTSCGCTGASASISTVPAGEVVEVSAQLRLTAPGRRVEQVWLNLGELGIHTLVISATAHRPHDFFVPQKSVLLPLGSSKTIIAVATNTESDSEPQAPTITAPHGVAAQFEGWSLIHQRDQSRRRPARWHGTVTVSRASVGASPADKLLIQFSTAPAATVDLRGRAWN
ncbi:MAG: DUF1573 domain-containing protein [Phycisphaerales bacterium]|nr:DUF1573 domain-containing protein [Phycisphaerales bacterium]